VGAAHEAGAGAQQVAAGGAQQSSHFDRQHPLPHAIATLVRLPIANAARVNSRIMIESPESVRGRPWFF
jgi:hypothetical protein